MGIWGRGCAGVYVCVIIVAGFIGEFGGGSMDFGVFIVDAREVFIVVV